MFTINFILEEKTVNRLTQNKAWLETYIPELVEKLDGMGFNVVFDQDTNFDLMHIHIPLSLTQRFILNYNGYDYPIVYHGHATEDSFTVGDGTKYFLRKWLKKIACQSDLIICPSRSTEEYYRALLPDHPVEQLNYGINLEKYSYSKEARMRFREQYGIGEDETVVSCVGGISRRKGIYEFLEVSRQHSDLRFMWVGGDYTNHIAIDLFYKIFARNGEVSFKDMPDNLLMPGYVNDIPAALSASDIFFFPSVHETQGLALVEAAANALPIVTRDLPVFNEWLKHGYDCLMGTCVDDFNAYIDMFAEDPGLCAKLGKHALESARKNHDINATIKRLASKYEELISNFRKRTQLNKNQVLEYPFKFFNIPHERSLLNAFRF
jgi:1,2-diacylglycerol-3-alpha-glucose alpha-1,2-glucosyltransferase